MDIVIIPLAILHRRIISPRPSMEPTALPTFSVSATFPTYEYTALYDMYYTMNGPHWAWNISTHETDTIHWNFTGGLNHTHNPCLERWEGITCVCTTMSCTIKELILNTHNLTGIIPETIGYLTNLHRLDLSTNQITGELPHTLFHILSLTNLSLEFNHINSTLPSNIGQLTNLTILQLAQNRIHGTLPWELCLLRNMSRLILSYNFLHGTIPTNWSSHILILLLIILREHYHHYGYLHF